MTAGTLAFILRDIGMCGRNLRGMFYLAGWAGGEKQRLIAARGVKNLLQQLKTEVRDGGSSEGSSRDH